jgi:hypothetical protein
LLATHSNAAEFLVMRLATHLFFCVKYLLNVYRHPSNCVLLRLPLKRRDGPLLASVVKALKKRGTSHRVGGRLLVTT